MELHGEAKLLRIIIGEADQVHHRPLYEAIIKEARTKGLAGATAWRGISGYGPTSRIRTSRILDLSSDMPVVVEIVDDESAINAFLPSLNELMGQARSGGLVTMEKVQIIKYLHGSAPVPAV